MAYSTSWYACAMALPPDRIYNRTISQSYIKTIGIHSEVFILNDSVPSFDTINCGIAEMDSLVKSVLPVPFLSLQVTLNRAKYHYDTQYIPT